MKEKLIIVGIIFGLLASSWGGIRYLDRYALCEDVKKVDQKADKTMQIMEYKFKSMELKTTEDRIYEAEKRYGTSPNNPEKKAELEKLKREREQVLREMKEIKEVK